ncbi:MAG: pallilysin-related adhesin [Spirochaetaceae bacterium]|jgi:flagellar motor protein MotB|nr:pallilysin-related adhesin [Spirochaetaceae bacterium]
MTRKFFRLLTGMVFITLGLALGALRLFPQYFFRPSRGKEQRQTQVIIPQALNASFPGRPGGEERLPYEAYMQTKVALQEGELLISLLTEDFDGLPGEEQIITYRNFSAESEAERSVYITYVDFDEDTQEYSRIWSVPTGITQPGTVSLYTKDLIGDRSVCVILSGMNGEGEQILKAFRKNPTGSDPLRAEPFDVIADIQISGAISIREVRRSQAYQNGLARGQSFSLVAYGRAQGPAETGSTDTVDQTEIIYAYDPAIGRYEQSSFTVIPRSQIEQRRLREVLSGGTTSFEAFVDGLWYYVSPQGTLDSRQYIYFDPQNRELVFFGEEAQQVFTWQKSSVTRYGLYIASQNISVTTLRRFLDLELESVDRIRVRVSEDVRLKIGVNTSWDGVYRKASVLPVSDGETPSPALPTVDGVYSGAWGKLQFFPNGVYELSSRESNRTGLYAFFLMGDEKLLELRPEYTLKGAHKDLKGRLSRETYLVEYAPGETGNPEGNLTLFPVRLGAKGIQKLHENPVFLVAYEPLTEKPLEVVQESPVNQEDPVPVLSYSSSPLYFSPDNDGVDDELFISLSAASEVPIVSWAFQIREPQPPYQVFYQLEGQGQAPARITWNGRSTKGELVQAATDYPFTFTALDSRGKEGSLNGTIGVDVLIIREEDGLRIQVPSIIFRAGYADFLELAPDIRANNDRVLRRIAEILNKFRDYSVRVEGHANRTQLDAAEEERLELQPLSQSRARAVVNQLVEFGVSRSRLTAIGMGSTKPVVQFEDRDNWWKNRRVEFILIK